MNAGFLARCGTLSVLSATCVVAMAQAPVGTAFTYQGQLKQAGVPGNGTADFVFTLWNAETGGTIVDSRDLTSVEVVDGLFTVQLDFGAEAFDGDARWLEIEVEFPSGEGNWTILSPRQPMTATPYALYALSSPGSAGNWAVNGNDIHNTNIGNVGIGTSDPLALEHIRGTDLTLSATALHGDDIIAEQRDAVIGLYSDDSGSWGSAISLGELGADGELVDKWTLARLTSDSTPGSALRLTFGDSADYALNAPIMHITPSGNVGIGTTEPGRILDVDGPITLRPGPGGIHPGVWLTDAWDVDEWFVGKTNIVGKNQLGFFKDGWRMVVEDNGNVGIGTNTPTEELEVRGDIKVSGHNGVIFSDGTKQVTAVSGGGGGVPSGFCILGETEIAPFGYTYTGNRIGKGLGLWAARAEMPTARSCMAAAVVNGRIYFIGGYSDSGGYLATNEEYDPATNTWTTKEDMPTPRDGLAAAAVNGKIYAIGGYTSEPADVATVEEYDPLVDAWTAKMDMPTARFLLAAAAVNGKIYAIGGTSYLAGTVATVEEYDPLADSWTAKSDMPMGRYDLAAVAVSGKIHAIGGTERGGATSLRNEEYDPATDTWTAMADMPMAREDSAAAVVDGYVYVFGGRYSGDTLATTEEYDPGTNRWTAMADMPTAREDLAAAAVNGKIYVVGGQHGLDVHLATNDEYTPGEPYYVHRKD